MKFLILCALLSLVIADNKFKVRHDLAVYWENLYEPHKNECIEESNAKVEDCYIKCVQTRLNFMNSNGNHDIDTISRAAKGGDLDIVEQAIDDARNEKELCQKAYSIVIIAVSKIAKRYPPVNQTN